MRLKIQKCGIPHASMTLVIGGLVSIGAPHNVSACVKTYSDSDWTANRILS